MNHKMFFFLTAVFLTSVLSGCSSLGKTESSNTSQPIEPSSAPSAAPDRSISLPDGWNLEIEITNEGSRSEGSISRLFYRYIEVPQVFDSIVIGKNIFEYKPMVNLWDEWGYIFAGTSTSSPASEGSINQDEMKQGWYQCDYSYKKNGTPSTWVWAGSRKINVWASPDRLNEVAELFSLERTGGAVLRNQ